MRLTILTPLLGLTHPLLVHAGGPGGPSNVKSAPAGPLKLSQCGCSPITDKMSQCQPVKGINTNIRDCVCIPNDKPDAWYGYIHNCRACLWSDNGDDANTQTFFDNLASTISQLFVSCTNTGGGVVSDGMSICASNAMFEACASLNGKGQKSWASFEQDGQVSNATFVLDIPGAAGEGDTVSEESSTSSSAGVTAAPSGSTSLASAPTDAGITTPTQPVTGTGAGASSTATSTSTSSARVLLNSESRVGGLVALLAAFGMGAILF